MSGTTLREIDEMWQDEYFPPAEDPEPVGGQRVTRFQGYLDQVDWTDEGHVSRAVRVFEVALRFLFKIPDNPHWDPSNNIQRIRKLLARDGYELTTNGRIVGSPTIVVTDRLLSNLKDPLVIQDHLSRIATAIERDDPAQVIGSAKELVESTAKVVLRETGHDFTENTKLPDLVRRAQEALSVHPGGAPGNLDNSEIVKKILGASVTITNGIAELRNRGFGTGHGPGTARNGLGPRHARLAVNAVRLWCEFMLDTLSDERAPWRKAER
ncbi:abortive infection family protein [Saccharomonospora piscinae]|nr:abortive infection family protein [Saccharomonospora piscinae]